MSFEKTTGKSRASEVLISSTVNGITKTIPAISMLTAIPFTSHAAITIPEFKRLSLAGYEARRDAFITYLQSQYYGLTISPDGSIIDDTAPADFIN